MQTIYADGNYKILADTVTGDARVVGANGSISLSLYPEIDMPKYMLQFIQDAGLSRYDFFAVRGCSNPLRIAAKGAWIDAVAEYETNKAKAAAEREAELAAKLPGLSDLRDALEDECRYQREFGAMMEDESNDGALPPRAVTVKYDDLAEKYPAATLYLKALGYCDASNHHKSTAGRKAAEMLEASGQAAMSDAAEVLDNWLPSSAAWD